MSLFDNEEIGTSVSVAANSTISSSAPARTTSSWWDNTHDSSGAYIPTVSSPSTTKLSPRKSISEVSSFAGSANARTQTIIFPKKADAALGALGFSGLMGGGASEQLASMAMQNELLDINNQESARQEGIAYQQMINDRAWNEAQRMKDPATQAQNQAIFVKNLYSQLQSEGLLHTMGWTPPGKAIMTGGRGFKGNIYLD